MKSHGHTYERELSVWRYLGGVTVGWLLFAVIAATTDPHTFGETFLYYSLVGLLGLWVIGGPLIYFINIRPRTRNKSQENDSRV